MGDHRETLRSKGLKHTPHRAAVLDTLAAGAQPLSAEQIFLRLRSDGVAINLSTVYRTLETLTTSGLVVRLSLSGEDKTLFEYSRVAHRHHLVCLGCKKILSIEHCPLEGYESALAQKTDFTIVGHRLNVFGYCPQCRETTDRP